LCWGLWEVVDRDCGRGGCINNLFRGMEKSIDYFMLSLEYIYQRKVVSIGRLEVKHFAHNHPLRFSSQFLTRVRSHYGEVAP
jgi:hypothetical protein